jgi:hypothetical protein
MRGCVYRLQLLKVLASAVILGSDSFGTHDHNMLPQIRDSSKLEGQVAVFISPRYMVAQLYPKHWVPFSSPPKTRRATVEVFQSASTWVLSSVQNQVKVEVTLGLAVYRQSFRFGDKTLETHNQRFFQLNPCGHSPYVTTSLTRRWVCLV